MKAAATGDLFVVFKYDRLAQSTKKLYQLTDEQKNKNAVFVSSNDAFDTSKPTDKAMFGMLTASQSMKKTKRISQHSLNAGVSAI